MNMLHGASLIVAAWWAAIAPPALAAEPKVVAAAPSASASTAGTGKPSIVIDAFSGTGGRGGEAAVQKTVIEDDSARIEELRVRGQLTHVVVTSKNGAGSYEIITGDASRDLSDGRNTSRGAAGKRVWNVLRF